MGIKWYLVYGFALANEQEDSDTYCWPDFDCVVEALVSKVNFCVLKTNLLFAIVNSCNQTLATLVVCCMSYSVKCTRVFIHSG